MTKFHDSPTAAVVCLRFFAGHLLVKGKHGRAFFAANHRTALLLILRATLWLPRTALAVSPLRFVAVIRKAFLFRVASFIAEQLALRTNKAIPFTVVNKRRRRKPF